MSERNALLYALLFFQIITTACAVTVAVVMVRWSLELASIGRGLQDLF